MAASAADEDDADSGAAEAFQLKCSCVLASSAPAAWAAGPSSKRRSPPFDNDILLDDCFCFDIDLFVSGGGAGGAVDVSSLRALNGLGLDAGS